MAVTDGVLSARAVSFFQLSDQLIHHVVEYWPDPFPPAEWRAQWVEQVRPPL